MLPTKALTPALACLVLACLVLALSACASKPPKPVQTRTWLTAAADANPDLKGRASPVVVRVFQLKSETEFNSADFFALYEKEKETLGSSFLLREEYVLQPGEQRELLIPLARDARYIGAIAAFRDIRSARWRALSVAPRRTVGDTFSRDRMTLAVERTAIKLTVKD